MTKAEIIEIVNTMQQQQKNQELRTKEWDYFTDAINSLNRVVDYVPSTVAKSILELQDHLWAAKKENAKWWDQEQARLRDELGA